MGELSYTTGGNSNLVSFRSAARVPITSLKAHFLPKQDLHGYSKPWPAGGGKNKLGFILAENVSNSTNRTVTFTNDYIRINASGSASTNAIISYNTMLSYCKTISLPVGTYTFSVSDFTTNISGITKDKIQIVITDSNNTCASDGETFTLGSTGDVVLIKYDTVISWTSGSYIQFHLQLEEGSSTTTWEPYENICPIEGWNSVTVKQCGKNIYNPSQIRTHGHDDWDMIMVGEKQKETGSWPRWTFIDKAFPNATYYWTTDCYEVGFLDKDENVLVSYMGWGNKQRTAPSNAAYIYHTWIKNATLSADEVEAINKTMDLYLVQSSFEPQQGQVIPVEFPVLGKNKFNKNTVTDYYRINASGEIIAQAGMSISDYIEVIPNQTYTITHEGSLGANKRHAYYDKNKNYLGVFGGDYGTNKIIIIPSNAYYIRLSLYNEYLATTQLELGDTATTYEPYDSNNTVYGGYVDVAKGEVVATHKQLILTGEETGWRMLGTVGSDKRFDIAMSLLTGFKVGNWFSDKLAYGTSMMAPFGTFMFYSTTGLVIPDRNNNFSDLETFKNWLSTNNLEFAAELTTPITYKLTPTQLTSLLGQNTFWSNTNGTTEVSYAIHDSTPMRATRARIAANQPHIATASGAIASFQTDMKAPIQSLKVGFMPIQDLNGYDKPWPAGGNKNLFNINVSEQNPSDTTPSNTTVRTFTPNTYCVGTSWSNWWQPNQVTSYSISNGTLTVQNNNVYGVGFAFKLKANTAYAISATNTNGGISLAYYDSNGEYITTSQTNIINTSFTTPAEADITVLTFYTTNNSAAATFSKIQLEESSSVTSYVPYENICPISGWTEINATRCGKNFSPVATGTEMVQKLPLVSGYRYFTFSGMPVDQEFTLSASFTKAYNTSSNKRLYLNGRQTINSTTNSIFMGPSASGPVDKVIHNWVDTSGNISISHNNRGLTNVEEQDGPNYAASLQNIQLELGHEATSFEPYNGTTIPLDWSSTVGTIYGGYVDLITGELVTTHAVITLTGQENTYGYASYWANMITVSKEPVLTSVTYCNILPCVNPLPPETHNRNNICHAEKRNDTLTVIGLGLIDSFADKQSFIDYAQSQYENGTPIQIVGELETPITYQLTPTQFNSLRGTNNIWTTANGPVDIQYWRH